MPTTAPETGVSVTEVRSRADLDAFVRLPYRLYQGDRNFVPPLERDIRIRLDPKRHPYFEHGEAALFLARRSGTVVGRIAATVNRLHNEFHGETTGFFGFFEAERNPSTAGALFDAAAGWLRPRGQTVLRGPASLSSNDEFGFLHSGEPGPPVLMMPYNPPWYGELCERAGFTKAMDLWAWRMTSAEADSARWERVCTKVMQREGLSVRTLDMRRFRDDVRIIQDLYQDAWSRNWGFVPMTDAEFEFMAKELRPIVVPELCVFVMKDGREVGFALALPDLNRIIINLRGRLFPFGIVRILLGRRKVGSARVITLGVRRALQGHAIDSVLYHHITKNCVAAGMPRGEMSWVLETNTAMNNALDRAGATHYRTYRVYERRI